MHVPPGELLRLSSKLAELLAKGEKLERRTIITEVRERANLLNILERCIYKKHRNTDNITFCATICERYLLQYMKELTSLGMRLGRRGKWTNSLTCRG